MYQSRDNLKNKEQKQYLTVEGRVPPQAVDMERAVLAAITLEKDAYETIADLLTPECFYSNINQVIFKAMKTLASKNQPIDLLTISEQLRKTDELELIGGPYELTKMQNGITSATNILTHAKVIYQKYHLRELIKVSSEIMSMAYDESADNFEVQDQAEKLLSDLGANNIGEMVHISRVMSDTINKIEEWRQVEGTITGIPSGFPELDRATRGWQPGDLIIIAARPSVGKTAFALNVLKNAASNNIKPVTVAAWSLEMKAVYLVLRMLSAESKTILYKIQTGKLSESEMENMYNSAVKKLSSLNIYFDENSHITMQSLARKARRLKKKNGLGMIVIDYVQLMSGDESNHNREREVAKISRDLKTLALELDIPIIALSQLNRNDGEKGVMWDNGPGLSAIRESGAIEQDADVVMMLWGANDEEIKQNQELFGRRKVRIVKQRNGVLKTIELNFKSEIQLFEKIEEVDNRIPGNYKPVSEANYYEPKNVF